jgi:phosphoribosylformylglycinamidine cyclo-ligase
VAEGRAAYTAAGVDVAAGDRAVELMRAAVARTNRPEVLGGLGGFGAAITIPAGYREPVLVASTDGVGTKTAIAAALGRYDTIGRDLVAMCADDVVCSGAAPLFFLDYVAVGHLDPEQVADLVGGVAAGCSDAGCALVGGETAEHPGLMEVGEFDLAGFCVGVVDQDAMIGPDRVVEGDVLIGLASSGLHANGYSLVRSALLDRYPLEETPPHLDRSLADELLEPCAVYAPLVRALAGSGAISSAAHITGGGFTENIPRALPARLGADVDVGSWPVHPVFGLVREASGASEDEMFATFNMGIGMVLVVPDGNAADVVRTAEAAGTPAFAIGRAMPGAEVRRHSP